MLTSFFNWIRSLLVSKAVGAPKMFTETRKIRVNSVQAADPSLTITLAPTDGGTFPPYLQAVANITSNTGGRYQATGSSQANGTSVVIVASFADNNFPNETTLSYQITLNVSQTGTSTSWTPFTGTVDGASGTTPT